MKANLLNVFTFLSQDQALKRFLVNDKKELSKGDIVFISLIETKKDKLYICCPSCGECSFTGTHDVSKTSDNIVTVKPSIKFQCCGYHCFLINSEFEES